MKKKPLEIKQETKPEVVDLATLHALAGSISSEIVETGRLVDSANTRLLYLESASLNYTSTMPEAVVDDFAHKVIEALKLLKSAQRFLKQITE
jgi:hypothetical protein